VDQPFGVAPEDAVDRDLLLTNVSLYWFTGTGASAAHFYYPDARIEHWCEYEAGGHSAALEEPELFVNDVGTFLRRFR
jgi:hypothetical protein